MLNFPGTLKQSAMTMMLAVMLVGVWSQTAAAAKPQPVTANAETVPVTHSGDAADDPSLWVHPSRPGRSLLIGNDKQGALSVYKLDGSLKQRITTSKAFWGNSDVRQRVRIAGATRDVVAALNGGLRLYTVGIESRRLRSITDGSGLIPTRWGEGLCLYDSRRTGRLSAFVISRAGQVRQFAIHDRDRDNRLQGSLIRQFDVGSEAEGCVADDRTGALYVAEEDVALWRYRAEPTAGARRIAVDRVRPRGNLAPDIEGVTMVELRGRGYVLASAQNVAAPERSYFVAYGRRTNSYVKSFRITSGARADGCQRTDGITAHAGYLGPRFPQGAFVCQDNWNSGPGSQGRQNFKLTRLERILDLRAAGR